MAKAKEVESGEGRVQTFYVPIALQPNVDRLKTLCDKYHLSMGLILNLLIDTCLDTLEKEIPEHRKFTINGKEIIL